MASLRKKGSGKGYNVIYWYADEHGKRKQKWESVPDLRTAKARKAEIESEQSRNAFVPPRDMTVRDFLKEFVETYGQSRWGVSMYDSNTSLIRNYINPLIGDIPIQRLTPRVIDRYIQQLKTTSAVSTKTRRARTEYVTEKTIEKIYRLLHCAFGQAVRWEYLGKNPFEFPGTVKPAEQPYPFQWQRRSEYLSKLIFVSNVVRFLGKVRVPFVSFC